MKNEIQITEMQLGRKNVNLALLESVTNDLIALAISKDLISRNEYLPLLISALRTYKGGCRELNEYDSFKPIFFKELKEGIAELMIDYEQILEDSLLPYKVSAEINKIKEYDCIEEKVYKSDLNQKELLVLINMIVTRFHRRLKNDNYTDFDELTGIEECNSTNKTEIFEKPGTANNPSGKQIAWIILIRKEIFYTMEDKSKLAIKYSKTSKSLIARLYEVSPDFNSIHRRERPTISRNKILSDLDIVIQYFEKRGEVENMKEAQKLRDIVYQGKLNEKKESKYN